VAWLAVAFTNPVMSYSYLIFTELPAGLLLSYAFRRLALGWAANGPWRLLMIGWCIAYIPWIAWRCVPVAAALGLYALVQWWRHRTMSAAADVQLPSRAAHAHTEPQRPLRFRHESAMSFAPLAAPVVLSALLAAWYSLFLFGTVVPAGGGSLVRGQPALFNWPWDGLGALGKYLTGAFGLLFDRQMGLVVYAPFYLLAIVGGIAMFKLGRPSDRRVLLWIAAFVLPYMGVVAAFEWWNGVWSPPARYWATFVPLLAGPVAMSLALVPGRLYKSIFALLAVPGFAFMAAMMADPRRLFPNEREEMLVRFATDPELPVRIDLWNTLPNFTPPDALTHPMSTGVLTFAALAILLLCYFLIERRRGTHFAPAWAPAAQMSVWLGVVALVGTGWFTMNLDHFRPKTLLAQVGQWGLEPAPSVARGIAYHQGKLYIPGYESRTLVALDAASGESTVVQPVSAGTPLTYTHPGAVAVGPDGLLYVLNNGDGPDALFAMRPDGEVVRRIPLGGKSNIAAGLAFDPDGAIYIGDTMGGRIWKYSPDGGEPLAAWGGVAGGFNNLVGVVADEDGTVYGAEMSGKRVQQIDSAGNFVRAYDLGCPPWYIARSGEWLDVSCESKLVSINTTTHEIRAARLEGNGTLPGGPIGLAYGPDGTLYVVNGDNSVFAYTVRR
jgi:outer membrane protein assembly factor BamB